MHSFARITASPFTYLLCLLCVFTLALGLGCSRDPEQRTAYKAFLEELVPQQGYQSLPDLTPEQIAAFGPYALSYQQLYDFTKSIEASVEECATRMAVISEEISTPKDIMEHQDEIQNVREFIAKQPELWDAELQKLAAHKAELNLHEEVAPLYEELYQRYTNPVEQVKPVVHAMLEFLESNLHLAWYLNENAGKVEFQGNMIIFNDEAAHQKANDILAQINQRAQQLYASQEELSRYLIINKN